MQVTRSRLKEIILEELSLIERGFGEGEPPGEEIYDKKVIALEGELTPAQETQVLKQNERAMEIAEEILTTDVQARAEAEDPPLDPVSIKNALLQLAGN